MGVKIVEIVKTGEVGFCKQCGDVVEVGVTVEDRLQSRTARRSLRKWRGWTTEQMATIEVGKLMVELGELAAELEGWMPQELYMLMEDAADVAKFQVEHGSWRIPKLRKDNGELIAPAQVIVERMGEELVEVQREVFCLASVIEALLGEQVDVARLAAAEKPE